MLADTVRRVAEAGGVALVLTHTHAGVHAIRHKLRAFDVPEASCRVATITSLAFDLARSYSRLGGTVVPETPDWGDSGQYIEAASRVASHRHIRDVIAVSYTHVFVDEYQDCSKSQHNLVLELKRAVPECAVFGDPLQGIFGFAEPIVAWDSDVLPNFPAFEVQHRPMRWKEHNEPLGDWLVSVRTALQPGEQFNVLAGAPAGVSFQQATQAGWELVNAALAARPPGETVVVVTPLDPQSARRAASKLKGVFSTMEDVGGTFMVDRLKGLAAIPQSGYAKWLADLAKECFEGYGQLNAGLLSCLDQGRTVSHLKRPGLGQTQAALDAVVNNQSLGTLADAMKRIASAREARLHSREAWKEISFTIESCARDDERELTSELARRRDRLRRAGRPASARVVSRTVLIKGLEYDHVIIANLDRITDACNLYVALTRARKTVTVIGSSQTVEIRATSTRPSSRRRG